jgi:hypothetical protein
MAVMESQVNTAYNLLRGGSAPYSKAGVIAQDASRSEVFEKYTVVSKQVIDPDPTAVLTASGTANGTLINLSIAPDKNPIVGDYTLTCVAEASNGGTFDLEDPNGVYIGRVVMTAGAGAETNFNLGGIVGTLKDGSEDFDATDVFTITVAEGSGEYVPFDATVTGANSIDGVYLGEDIAAATLVAGSVSGKIAYLGSQTIYDKNLVVFEGSGQSIATLLPDGESVEKKFNKLGFTFVDTVDTLKSQPTG